MHVKKLGAFALAMLLVLGFASLALAQPSPEDQTNAAVGGGVLIAGCICFLVILAINIAILVWVYKDAQARGAEPMLWLILVFFTGLIGLIIWLIVRPPLREPPMGEPPV